LEFKEVVGNSVKVHDGTTWPELPLEDVKAIHPTDTDDLVVPVIGEGKGRIFKVKTYTVPETHSIREPGKRLRKHEVDLEVATNNLVQVFPAPKR
jgi:hypothetical protein